MALIPQYGGHMPHVVQKWMCTVNRDFLRRFLQLSPRKLHPLLEEEDPENDSPKNYSFRTFATHMTQTGPKKYDFIQFAAFYEFLFTEINYYFV